MLVLLLFLFLIAPVRLSLLWDGGQFSTHLSIWGIPLRVRPSAHASSPSAGQRLLRLIRAILRARYARRHLLRHVEVISLRARILLHLNDAAATACLTGLLRLAAILLPAKAEVAVHPAFFRQTDVHARCILFFHLGMVFTTGALLAAEHLLSRLRTSKEA